MTTNQNTEIRPFTITIPEADLEDLRSRLARTRYAVSAPGDGWEYGTPTSYLQDMVERWKSFDWRAQEARMNAVPNFVTEIDGQTVHFVHVRSAHEDATPLLLLHTYPGSFAEFLDMIGPLTDPEAHGGRAEDAFHVVVPSMPGFGFSTPLVDEGWTMARVARTYDQLMRRLGYSSYGTHGSDGGRDGVPGAGDPEPRGLPGCARAAAVLVPVRRPEPSSRSSGRRSTPRWSSSAGSSRSAATTR